ncbi:hypothetical protein A5739_00520 [Mycobacterium colombiense]|nr:hypothetical protein A5739_00520 [Mycobacterium colombiense]
MNLTNATKSAIIKYPWARDTRSKNRDSKKYKKFNAYADDLKTLKDSRKAVGLTNEEQTLEASIMDIADDITYALHDLEDFYTGGLFPRNHVVAVLDDYSRQFDLGDQDSEVPVTNQYLELDEYARESQFKRELFDQAVDRVRILVRYGMYRYFDGSRGAFALIRTAFATRIDAYIRDIYIPDTGPAVAKLSDDHWYEIQVLKWLTRKFIRDKSELAITQLGQGRLMEETLNKLFEWCSDEATELKLPPALAELTKAKTDADRARGVVDYVASGTDAQLISLANSLRGAAPPSSLFFV